MNLIYIYWQSNKVVLLLVLPSLTSHSTRRLRLSGLLQHLTLILPHVIHWRHVVVAQMSLIAMVLLILIFVVVIVFSRIASLHSLIHSCALHSLLWSVYRIMSWVAWLNRLMLRQLHLLLVLVSRWWIGSLLLLSIELGIRISWWLLWSSYVVSLAVLLDLCEHSKASLRRN